jgi:hypothetical protein
LLKERNNKLSIDTTIENDVTTIEHAQIPEAKSPEIYFGAWRNERLGNGPQFIEGEHVYERPSFLEKNKVYFVGLWDTFQQFAQNKSVNASILFVYEAKNVNIVASSSASVEVIVTIDDSPVPLEMRGKHITEQNGETILRIKDEQLYEIIQDISGVSEHSLKLEVLKPGLDVFTFTFG